MAKKTQCCCFVTAALFGCLMLANLIQVVVTSSNPDALIESDRKTCYIYASSTQFCAPAPPCREIGQTFYATDNLNVSLVFAEDRYLVRNYTRNQDSPWSSCFVPQARGFVNMSA
jgi:hypothetical protein